MYKLYEFLPSGNAYKVRLLLTQLQIPFELIEINPLKDEGGFDLTKFPAILNWLHRIQAQPRYISIRDRFP